MLSWAVVVTGQCVDPVTSGQVGMLGWAVVVTGQCVASYQWPGWYAGLGCGRVATA